MGSLEKLAVATGCSKVMILCSQEMAAPSSPSYSGSVWRDLCVSNFCRHRLWPRLLGLPASGSHWASGTDDSSQVWHPKGWRLEYSPPGREGTPGCLPPGYYSCLRSCCSVNLEVLIRNLPSASCLDNNTKTKTKTKNKLILGSYRVHLGFQKNPVDKK